MSIKHKVLKDFQLVTEDKKIIVLKAKTVLEGYTYTSKNESVLVEKDIIDNNPDFFQVVDWKEELTAYLRQNKIAQPAVLSKKLVPFIQDMFVIPQTKVEIKEVTKEVTKEVPVEIIKEVKIEVIKEVPVEVIKEVPVEVIKEVKVSKDDPRKQIELDARISKNEMLEKHLQNKINSMNQREIELEEKERDYEVKKKIVDDKEFELEVLAMKLLEKQKLLAEKDSNFENLIDKNQIMQKLENISQESFNRGDIFRDLSGRVTSIKEFILSMDLF